MVRLSSILVITFYILATYQQLYATRFLIVTRTYRKCEIHGIRNTVKRSSETGGLTQSIYKVLNFYSHLFKTYK